MNQFMDFFQVMNGKHIFDSKNITGRQQNERLAMQNCNEIYTHKLFVAQNGKGVFILQYGTRNNRAFDFQLHLNEKYLVICVSGMAKFNRKLSYTRFTWLCTWS